MTEQTAKRITLADPEDIADLVNRFALRLKEKGYGDFETHSELVKEYQRYLLDELLSAPGQRGYLSTKEPDA